MTSLKGLAPWWLKLGLKVGLSRLPIPYSVWKRVGLFEHGSMDRGATAIRNFLEHANTVELLARWPTGFTVLELGPGDSVMTGVIAKSVGASHTWMIDADDFASKDLQKYHQLASLLVAEGYNAPWTIPPKTFVELLSDTNAEYGTNGLASLKAVPDASVTFLYSNAVLEHLEREFFGSFVAEFYRVLTPDGVSVHRVDLKDHLGGALNNLRFSSAVWEAPWFRSSGFYTNRIRCGEMLADFRSAGFNVEVARIARWESLPTRRTAMSPEFSSLDDTELLVSGFDVVLRKPTECARPPYVDRLQTAPQ